MQFEAGQRIHLVGIGGFGISAIARILLERGFTISGSDRNSNSLTEALARDGATIYHGHDAQNIDDADLAIMSSAIPENHVEIQAARDRGIPVYKRKDMLGALLDGHKVIAVAGTHGKTTTTSMIIHILRFCGLDPSYIVGGILKATGTNAGVGSSDFFVIEADEYDNMFHGIYPRVAVLTNVEYDHPDFFKSEAELVASFEKFIDNVASVEGGVYVCAESELAMRIVDNHPNSKWFSHTYGINQGSPSA
jgi:UDP-N-acetylmuramate--alanine ligase